MTDDGDQGRRAKAAAREAIRTARRERLAAGGPEGRKADASALASHGMAWLAEHERHLGREVGCVTAYQEMATEPPVGAFVQALLDRGVQVLMPITLPDSVLRWRAAEPGRQDNPLIPQPHLASAAVDGPSGEPTPADGTLSGSEALAHVDVAFIPALALGHDGTRLGQGGGYYDRAIPTLRSFDREVPVVAVVYPGEVGRDVPALRHDISVDAALTTRGLERMAAGPSVDGAVPAT